MNGLDSLTAKQNNSCPVCGNSLSINGNGTYKHCSNCGYNETLIIGDVDPIIRQLGTNQQATKDQSERSNTSVSVGGMYGWICPKCGAVLSPFTSYCPNCTKSNWEITCNTTTDSKNFDVQQFLNGKDKWGFK